MHQFKSVTNKKRHVLLINSMKNCTYKVELCSFDFNLESSPLFNIFIYFNPFIKKLIRNATKNNIELFYR